MLHFRYRCYHFLHGSYSISDELCLCVHLLYTELIQKPVYQYDQPLVDHTDKLVSGLIQYKEDARKGKVRPKSNNYRGGNGNSDSGNVASDNFGNTIDYASSPVSNF